MLTRLSVVLPRDYGPSPALRLGIYRVPASLLCFALLLFVGLVVSWNSLAYPWFYDDLHLIRPYSEAELASVLTTTWDPDRIETPGYRPLTAVFNHFRAIIFGESVVWHRLFQITLVAAYLSVLGVAGTSIGIPWWQTVAAGITAICAKNNWFNLVWIADAVHVVAGLFWAGAVVVLIAHTAKPSAWKVPAAVVLATLALLIREETLAAFPVAIALGLMALRWGHAPGSSDYEAIPRKRRGLVTASVALIGVAAVFLMLRAIFVTESQFDLAGIGGLLNSLYQLTSPMGSVTRAWRLLWVIALCVLVVLAVWRLPRDVLERSALLFACAAVTCIPTIVVARPNLLFVPISLFSLALVHIVGELVRGSRVATLGGVALLAVVAALSADRSMIAQEVMHPMSFENLVVSAEILYGTPHAPFQESGTGARRWTIPEGRVEEMKTRLARVGIDDRPEWDNDRIYDTLLAEALFWGRDRPGSDNRPFFPRIGFASW